VSTIPPALPDPAFPTFSPMQNDDATGGTSFAAMLDQMLGGDEPGGQTDAGDLRVAHFTGAEMFDEDGLFRGAPWSGPARMPKADLMPSAPQASDVAQEQSTAAAGIVAAAIPAAGGNQAEPEPSTLTGPDESRSAGSATDLPSPIGRPTPGTVAADAPAPRPLDLPSSPEPMTAAPAIPPFGSGEWRTASGTRGAARPAQPPRAQGTATETQLAAHVGTHGVNVVARLDQTTRTERLRLRDRLAAMLARHGFAVDAVRVDATAQTYSQERE